MTNQFTILIPYHAELSTLDMLKRQLNYYSKFDQSFLVLLALSGDRNLILQVQEFVANLSDEFAFFAVEEADIKNKRAFYDKLLDLVKTGCYAICRN